jgi:hypothetical protein
MRIHLALVAENTPAFLNQVKLCLYSLRRNGGKYKDVPVTLIVNNEELSRSQEDFLTTHFAPIQCKVMPRLGAIPHTSKLNAFFAIDPKEYDILLFLDCDTVIMKPLDAIFDPLLEGKADFICRRWGETDRNRFVDFDGLVKEFCGSECRNKIIFKEKEEWPMFNSGVFMASSDAIVKIRKNAVDFTYKIYDEWMKNGGIEHLPIIKHLYSRSILRSRRKVLESWTIEQGALALSCIKAGVRIQYLNEKYNSWWNLADLVILHCFKSAYKFSRENMFSKTEEKHFVSYKTSEIPGKRYLAEIVEKYKKEFVTL